MSELGKLVPPYPVEQCANADCLRALDEAEGAYLFKVLDDDKLCVFCDDCARHVELNASNQFMLVAL